MSQSEEFTPEIFSDSMACSSGLLFLKITQQMRKPVFGGYASDHHMQITQNWHKWAVRKGSSCPFLGLSDLSTGVNWLKESLGHRNKAREWFLFCVRVQAVISACLFPWGRAHQRWEAVLGGSRELPMPTSTNHQGRAKHGLICKEAFAKFSAFLPWKTKAGPLSTCIIPTYTYFAQTCTKWYKIWSV